MSQYRVSSSYDEISALSPEYEEASSISHFPLIYRTEGRDRLEGGGWQVGQKRKLRLILS